jgi:hypothetical protein
LKKEKTLTLGSKLAVVEGGGVDGDEVADGEKCANHKSM